MKDITDEIIDYLIRNRVSTTEVTDAMGKTGVMPGLYPISRGQYKAGKIKWVYAYDESNWPVHEQIQDIEEDNIILVETFNCGERAIFGELVSKYLLLYRQSRAIVVKGKVRDAAGLIKENWPIWCEGFTPVGCYNRKPDADMDAEIIKTHSEMYDGAIAVCDDCGCVVIPKDKINREFLEALQKIEDQEDIWFDRLNHYKENTFDIVCMKKYLSDQDK
ncbi:MAG TPA: RraA family protein [Lachnospiraceae bacterium]|nr:RraA family protein [Lachnospiraceae bacterium]